MILSKQKPVLIEKPEYKFQSVLFLPEVEGRKGDGGLRTKGYFKHSYERIDGTWSVRMTNDNLLKLSNELQNQLQKIVKQLEEEKFEQESIQVENNKPHERKSLLKKLFFKSTKQINDSTNKPLTSLPLITIITVVFNGAEYLEQTILSVLNQTYNNIEYIIIDGGSSDGTVDIIKKYEDRIDCWISEKDDGIADAFNKGIKLSNGEIVGIINAGDWYEIDAVSNIVECKEHDIIHGLIQLWDNDEKSFISIPIQSQLRNSMSINHPSVYVKKEVYMKCGYFNKQYKLAMDYEFLLRANIAGYGFYNSGKIIANFRKDGVSDRGEINGLIEVFKAKRLNLNNNIVFDLLYLFSKICKSMLSRGLKKIGLTCIVRFYSVHISKYKKL